jgi:hypothetical protein
LTAGALDHSIDSELIAAARTDASTFCDYVLRDEKSGAPIESAHFHREWHALASKHPRLVIESAIELGKSQQLVIGRTLFELGRDANQTALIVANTATQASKIIMLIGQYIEQSNELHRVFPDLRPDPSGLWTQSAITVQRSAPRKDPSVQGIGVHGSIVGARISLLVIDDACDYENSRTTRARDDLSRWVDATLLGRLTADARVIAVGNPWHRDDLLARLTQRPGWVSRRYPVEHGMFPFRRSRWPERWPASRIAAVRADLGPREAARQLDCVAPEDAEPIIAGEWIARALAAGENAPSEYYSSRVQSDDAVVLGVDTAYSDKRSADESALVLTRAFRATGKREVTHVEAGRWNLDELVARIVDRCRMSRAVAAIESNAGGEYVAQAVEKHVPVIRLHTSATSKKLRVDMLSSELATERWAFLQAGHLPDEMRKLAQEALSFSWDEHTGDRLSAWLVAVEALREREQRRRVGRIYPGVAEALLQR